MAANGPKISKSGGGLSGRPTYQVVARRYRPQNFEELVGQEHVARVLSKAVAQGRVGHAYLFTGARGVGKTSTARILAKALNCRLGPTPTPCNECESCLAIAAGSDIDVLEIDGASNRGIDEIRQLRQNVTVRPSHSRYKIYIIDEVHMLTREAFNALLKTLEEPPEHVKFIMCTTEPHKLPPTILSRCQRFDFAGISIEGIVQRLQQIAAQEGVAADPEALRLLARRAGGSMRDAQSLLEQVLSFAGEQIDADTIRSIFGLANDEDLAALVDALAEKNPGAALRQLDSMLTRGSELSTLIEQLAAFFRDLMVIAAGCDAKALLWTSVDQFERSQRLAGQFGLETVFAILQILDHALFRMRFAFQPRIVAELAIARIARLQNLEQLVVLVDQLDQLESKSCGETTASSSASSARPGVVGRSGQAPHIEAEIISAAGGAGDFGDSVSADNRSRLPEGAGTESELFHRQIADHLKRDLEARKSQVVRGKQAPPARVELSAPVSERQDLVVDSSHGLPLKADTTQGKESKPTRSVGRSGGTSLNEGLTPQGKPTEEPTGSLVSQGDLAPAQNAGTVSGMGPIGFGKPRDVTGGASGQEARASASERIGFPGKATQSGSQGMKRRLGQLRAGKSEETTQIDEAPDLEAAQEAGDGAPASAPIASFNPVRLWESVLEKVGGLLQDNGKNYEAAAISVPNTLIVSFKPGYTLARSFCEKPENFKKLQSALAGITGTRWSLVFQMGSGDVRARRSKRESLPFSEKIRQVHQHPLVRRAAERLGGIPEAPEFPRGEDQHQY